MSSTKKIIIGLGVTGLAVWLLSGDRRKKTVDFVSKIARDLKKAMDKVRNGGVDTDSHYG
ncbi:MAG: hypothetical protein ACKO3B_02190 [Bacteroidota bacterium]